MNIKKTSFITYNKELKIKGYEYKTNQNNQTAIIISHGFLANLSMCKSYAKYLSKQGYVVFIFDFCGGGIGSKSDGKFSQMSVDSEIKDLKCVIQYVKQLSYIKDIMLMGLSQGGFVSALTACSMQKDISKLILFYPALCIPDDARKGKMMFFKFNPQNIPDKISFGPLNLGGCYPKAVINMNSIETIKSYNKPVLIVHGTKDPIVPIEYANKAYEAYKSNNNYVLFISIKNAGHGFLPHQRKKALLYLTEFLKKKS